MHDFLKERNYIYFGNLKMKTLFSFFNRYYFQKKNDEDTFRQKETKKFSWDENETSSSFIYKKKKKKNKWKHFILVRSFVSLKMH